MGKPGAVAAACAAILLAGCRAGGPRPVDLRLAAFLPEDAVVLAGVRVDELRATPLGARLAELVPGGGAGAHDVLASWDGRQWLVAVRGAGPGTVGDVMLAGDAAAVKAAVERQRAHGTGPRALLARAPAEAQVWAVSNGAPMIPDLPGIGNATRLLNAMGDIVAAADLRVGVRVHLAGECRDERNATIVGDAVRALVGVGRLGDALSVEQRQREVRIAGEIPQARAEKLIERFIAR
jgi:hypothetical protein